jgi:hypothetical protein
VLLQAAEQRGTGRNQLLHRGQHKHSLGADDRLSLIPRLSQAAAVIDQQQNHLSSALVLQGQSDGTGITGIHARLERLVGRCRIGGADQQPASLYSRKQGCAGSLG